MAAANDNGPVRSAALISVAIAIATPALAQDLKEGITSQSSGGQGAIQPSASVDSLRSNSSSWSSATWSAIAAGHLALGAGMTYQYDGSKGTTLGLVSWSSRENLYEWAAFRFSTPQTRRGNVLAEPMDF